jgi:Zn-dependent protease/CBS domain-containing protein
MGWSLTIGRIAGTSIRLHFTFLLLLAWIGIADYLAGGAAAAIASLVFILLIFACVTAHEFGHIFMARHFGVKTPEVILSPIGGMANMERIPEAPRQELLIALAGPAVNVVILLLLVIFAGVSPVSLPGLDFVAADLADRLAYINGMLVLFNLIPAFPMDGGRVLRALLSMAMGPDRATQLAARIGQSFAFLFVLLGLFYSPILLLVGIFVYFAATSEEQASSLRWMARGLKVSDAMERAPRLLRAGEPLARAVDALLETPQRDFPVVDAAGLPVGLLDREAMIAALAKHGRDAPISGAMRQAIVLRESQPLEQAIDRMRLAGSKAEVVAAADGRVIGLLSIENVAEMMMIRSAQPDWSFAASAGRRN